MPLVAPRSIECRRVGVRLVDPSDLPALLEVNGSDEVTAMLPYKTWSSMDDAQAWLRRMETAQDTGLALQFVVVEKASGSVVGSCLLFRFEEASALAELGYVLGRRHWGKGLMREALEALIDAAFGEIGLRRLEAQVDPRNLASARLLLKLGFTREGLLRQRWVAKGSARDVEMYGLLRSEWPDPDARGRVAGGTGR